MRTKLFKTAFVLLIIVGILDLTAEKFYLFQYIWWFDMLVHFLAGACVGISSLLVYSTLRKETLGLKKVLLISFVGALFIGILWEIYELSAGITTLADGLTYVTDTLSDLLMDISGGLLGALYGYRYLKTKNNE